MLRPTGSPAPTPPSPRHNSSEVGAGGGHFPADALESQMALREPSEQSRSQGLMTGVRKAPRGRRRLLGDAFRFFLIKILGLGSRAARRCAFSETG